MCKARRRRPVRWSRINRAAIGRLRFRICSALTPPAEQIRSQLQLETRTRPGTPHAEPTTPEPGTFTKTKATAEIAERAERNFVLLRVLCALGGCFPEIFKKSERFRVFRDSCVSWPSPGSGNAKDRLKMWAPETARHGRRVPIRPRFPFQAE